MELQKWRRDHGFTQETLAKALGVTTVTVGRWEAKMRQIPPFLHLALEALEARGGETKPREAKKKMRKEGNENG
jgi:transcriptional regulator with XRE-family HTH domain